MRSVIQKSLAHDRTQAMAVATLRLLSVLLALSIAGVAAAQNKTCECNFLSKDYEAYGTNGACGIFMYNKGRTCEISFAGAGASEEVMKTTFGEKLGKRAWSDNLNMGSAIFSQYLSYAKQGEKGLNLNTGFIEKSMIVLVRGALFRESPEKAGLPLKEIDTMFRKFLEQYKEQVAKTFRGNEGPFTFTVQGKNKQEKNKIVFSIGKGYVELNFKNIATVRAVYFSQHSR